MTVEYRRPRRPAWLYPEGTIIRTKYGRFRVGLTRTMLGLPAHISQPSPRREWVPA